MSEAEKAPRSVGGKDYGAKFHPLMGRVYGTGKSPRVSIAFTHEMHTQIADIAYAQDKSFAEVVRQLCAQALTRDAREEGV